ncbi:MAG: XisH protein [Bacteroidota bacterium]|jgi:hypothetical protein
MPAKDIYHEIVKNALINEGWTVSLTTLFLSELEKEKVLLT